MLVSPHQQTEECLLQLTQMRERKSKVFIKNVSVFLVL